MTNNYLKRTERRFNGQRMVIERETFFFFDDREPLSTVNLDHRDEWVAFRPFAGHRTIGECPDFLRTKSDDYASDQATLATKEG